MTKHKNINSTVYVVGNGLDISCGLKTKYEDFIIGIDNDFAFKNDNLLVNYFIKSMRKNGWIDLEIDLNNYFNKLDKDNKLDKETICIFKYELSLMKEKLTDFLKNQTVKSIDTSSKGLALIKEHEKDDLYIVSFNYTNTIQRYLKNNPLSGIRINHIHGTLENNNIIVGVQDDDNGYKSEKGVDFLYKSTHVKSQDVFEVGKKLADADKIVFFGYSLGETDYSYFQNLFDRQCSQISKPKNFVFYYWGDKGKQNITFNLRKLLHGELTLFYTKNKVELIDVSK